MCTVTFIPLEGHDYILTSNRDEFTQRSAKSISNQTVNGTALIFPRDAEAGGTWIATSNQDQTICILNGAFIKHERKLPYRRSRGLMALDFFSFENSQLFVNNYLFQGMEPFTMVIPERGKLYELRWDAKTVHFKELNRDLPHIWSSATLYDDETQLKRKNWFNDWVKKHEVFSLEAIMNFHLYAGEGNPSIDINMSRGSNFRTVSITNIIRNEKQVIMKYHDLLQSNVAERLLK